MLRAGCHKTVEHHHLAEQTRPRRKTAVLQDLSQAQAPPHLMANVHRPGLTSLLQADLIGMHRHDVVILPQPRSGRADLVHDAFDQRIGTVQGRLPLKSRLDSVDQAQPLLPRAGRQVTQRADRPLPWSLRRPDRLDQQVGAIAASAVSFDRLADEHDDLYSRDPGASFSSLLAPNGKTRLRGISNLRARTRAFDPYRGPFSRGYRGSWVRCPRIRNLIHHDERSAAAAQGGVLMRQASKRSV